MDKKFPMAAKSSDAPVKVEIVGLDEIFASAIDAENILCKYERFTEHVLLACTMPEIPRCVVHDEAIEGTMMPGALDSLNTILIRYRKMTRWMRQNGIDPEAVVGNGDEEKNLS